MEAPLESLPRSIAREHYRCESFQKKEIEEVFPSTWIVVARVSELPEPGSYLCFDEVGASLLVVRDEAGQIGVFHNRCRHRSTRMLEGRGRVDRVLCPYHGWRYGLDGGLVGAPGRQAFPEEAVATGLERARSELWGGFVWVNLDGSAPPLADYLGIVAPELDRYGLADMVAVEEACWELPCNWKAVLDNTNEPYHLPHVHRRTVGGLRPGFELRRLGPHYEVEMATAVSSTRRWLDRASLPRGASFGEEEQSLFRKYLVFPNTLVNVLPYHMTVFRPVPVDPGRCRLYYGFYRPRRSSLLGRLRARAGWAVSRVVFREDVAAMERFQRGVQSGGEGPLWLHEELESALAHFHDALDRWLAARESV